jgi:hypothetical protein
MQKVQLRDVAFSRSGDKGDTSNIGIIPYNEEDYDWLKREVTVEKVALLYKDLVKGDIRRYEFDGIKALNFVMEKALSGGVSRSLNLDVHGKSMGNLILRMELDR